MHHPDSEAIEWKRREILDDHQALSELLRCLELSAGDARACMVPLLRLRVVLSRHFAREEGGDGLFEIIENRAPHHAGRLLELGNEHRALLSDLTVLSRGAMEMDARARGVHIEGFVSELRRHEMSESRLLIEALCIGLDESE